MESQYLDFRHTIKKRHEMDEMESQYLDFRHTMTIKQDMDNPFPGSPTLTRLRAIACE